MAKRDRSQSSKAADRRLANGMGQGRGGNYKPYLRIQDVPSEGRVTRIKGWRDGRVHHLMSDNEYWYFLTLEWSQQVLEIREQYPLLPVEETLEIARECGVAHPKDVKTKDPWVMTTDFLVTVPGPLGTDQVDIARAVKPAEKLASNRVLGKLEIERRYWEKKGINWGVVTDREIPMVLAKNVERIHGARRLCDLEPLTETDIRRIATVLTPRVMRGDELLRDLTNACDERLGYELGTSLGVAYHLIANRIWLVDFSVPLNPARPLALIASGSAAAFDREIA